MTAETPFLEANRCVRLRIVRLCWQLLRALLAFTVLLALVIGLPWALVHFVGWPLPHHIPSIGEVQGVLLNPMSTQFLLDVLACLCWVVWFFFTLDVLRWTVEAVRGVAWPQVHPATPLNGLAAALIGAIVVTVLTNRTSPAHPATTAMLAADRSPITVTAPFDPGPARPVAAVQHVRPVAAPAPTGMVRVTEEVRAPQNGIYDSLWRVSDRVFNDGSRWPELFELNRGVLQPDGHVLEVPHLVRPGWKIDAFVPAHPAPADAQADDRPEADQRPSTTTLPSQAPPTNSEAPSQPGSSDRGDAGDSAAGLDLGTGAFVSFILAGLITAAGVSVRMWHRRHYRIGSGDRSDVHQLIAPVVRSLRLAHSEHGGRERNYDLEVVQLPTSANPTVSSSGNQDVTSPVATRVGVRHGREIALNLARTRGLGLTGPGATGAARALLLHLLAHEVDLGGLTRIVTPVADLEQIFPGVDVGDLPSTVSVVESLDAALNEMEAALLTRTRQLIHGDRAQPITDTLVLLGSPAQHAERRLQAVLDNGSTLGLVGVLFGQWRPGATVRLRSDGTVAATSTGVGDALAGTRLFTVPTGDATELLKLLREAEGPSDQSGAPAGDTHTPSPIGDSHIDQDSGIDDERGWPGSTPPRVESEAPKDKLLVNELRPVEPEARRADNEDESAAHRALALRVLGPVELLLDVDGDMPRALTAVLTPKQREVLVFLALHPQGVRREALNDAIWPDARPPRPFNSLHNALSLLRRALGKATEGAITDLVRNEDGRYHLDGALVSTDYLQLHKSLREPHPIDDKSLSRLHQAVDLYRADLAEDLGAPWVEPFRESIRRDVLDALAILIRANGDSDPDATLMLLERTRELDPYNEGVYRDIVRCQAQLGQYAAMQRTLRLLSTTLDEIGQRPTRQTLDLVDFLERRGNALPSGPPGDVAAS